MRTTKVALASLKQIGTAVELNILKSHHIHELCERKVVTLQYCPSTEMIADALTDPLRSTVMTRFVDQVELT